MRNQLFLTGEDDNESLISPFCWWRSTEEFDEQGHFKIQFSQISKLTPRLKVLRELERLALVATDGLDEFRHKLLMYRAGDFWVPTGGIEKEEMEIPPIITILLVGFSGSGKSSLVNLMYSVLGRSGLIPFTRISGNSSNCSTMYLEEHNVMRSIRNGFCVYDSRGFDYNKISENLEELSSWMVNGVHHCQLCLRSEDVGALMKEGTMTFPIRFPVSSPARFAQRKVNCPVVVANLEEIYKSMKKGDSKPLEAIKELFTCSVISKYENPLLILTHGDKLTTEERINGRLKICEFLGVSESTGVYDISCVTENGFFSEEADPVTAYALTEAIYRALIFSDMNHLPQRNFKDWVMLLVWWVIFSLSTFFSLLASFFSNLGEKAKMKL